MTRMQIQEFTFCPYRKRGLIMLKDVARRLMLAFDVHPDEVPRLVRMLKGSQQSVHPLHDFIKAFLDAHLLTPTDVVLDDILCLGPPCEGIRGRHASLARTG